jgi:ABC-type lipoprotein export system ATPase subunit
MKTNKYKKSSVLEIDSNKEENEYSPILKDLKIEIKKGSFIAIVGE